MSQLINYLIYYLLFLTALEALPMTKDQHAMNQVMRNVTRKNSFPRYTAFQTISSYFDDVDRRLAAEYPELNDYPTSIRELDEVPKYLLTLLEREYIPANLGNTIRGIQSASGVVEESEAFLFTVSTLKSNEKLVQGELHLFWKRMIVREQRRRTRIALHLVDSGQVLTTHRELWLEHEQPGWLALNITRTLNQFFRVASRGKRNMEIAVTFEVVRPDGMVQEVSVNKFMGRGGLGKPFVILFLNDFTGKPNLRAVTKASQKPTNNLSKQSKVEVLSPSHIPIIPLRQRRRKRNILTIKHKNGLEYVYAPSKPEKFLTNRKKSTKKRRKRKKKSKQRKLSSRKNKRKQKKRTQNFKQKKKLTKKQRRRRKRRKQRKEQEKARKISLAKEKRLHTPDSEWWKTANRTSLNSSLTDNETLCHRVPLRVDFGDLGWDRWVISPKYYRSHMCVGSCEFSANDKTYSHLSNHAFIQNMLHSIQVGANVAPPCCVPVRTSSQTLLYYDDNQNVILKTFPDMRVDECGCR